MRNLFQSYMLNDGKKEQNALAVVWVTKELTVSSVHTRAKLLSECAVCSLNLAGHKPAIKIQISLPNRQ